MLGNCPNYYLFFTKRGGEEIVGTTTFEAMYYSRVLDGVSAANIVATPKSKSEQDVLKALNPWEHEVAIVRGNEVVWQGPISDELGFSNADDQHRVSISCQDVMVWFQKRRVHMTRSYVQEDVGVIYRDLVENAMERDPSPNISVDIVPTGVLADREYEEVRRQIVWNALDELHTSGIDVCTVGRNVIVGVEDVPADHLGVLTAPAFRSVNVRKRGSDMANDLTVTGSGSTGGELTSATYSSLVYAPEDILKYGLLEGQTANFTLTTPEAAQYAAIKRWEFTRKPALYVQMTLTTKAPVEMARLIPGAMVELYDDSTLVDLAGEFRMSRLDCQVVAGSEGSVAEVISPIFAQAATFTEAL